MFLEALPSHLSFHFKVLIMKLLEKPYLTIEFIFSQDLKLYSLLYHFNQLDIAPLFLVI